MRYRDTLLFVASRIPMVLLALRAAVESGHAANARLVEGNARDGAFNGTAVRAVVLGGPPTRDGAVISY